MIADAYRQHALDGIPPPKDDDEADIIKRVENGVYSETITIEAFFKKPKRKLKTIAPE